MLVFFKKTKRLLRGTVVWEEPLRRYIAVIVDKRAVGTGTKTEVWAKEDYNLLAVSKSKKTK